MGEGKKGLKSNLQSILEFQFRIIESVKMKGSLGICHFINTWGQTKIWDLQTNIIK